jgi:VanZ family protein
MRISRKSLLFYWFPPAAWAGLIFFMSSRAVPFQAPSIPFIDKIAHLVLYGGLCFLIYRAFDHDAGWSRWKSAAWAVVATTLYGMTDEYHQSFVAERSCDPWDWVSDTLGASIIFAYVHVLNLLNSSRKRVKH